MHQQIICLGKLFGKICEAAWNQLASAHWTESKHYRLEFGWAEHGVAPAVGWKRLTPQLSYPKDSPLQEPKPCTHILGRKTEKEEHIKNCLAKRSMKMQERNRSKFLNQILASMLSPSITCTCLYIPKLDVWLLSAKQRAQEILHKGAFSYQILGTSHLPIYLVWTLTNIWAHSNISVEKGNVVITSLQKGNQNIERPRELPKVPLIRLCLSWFQISILRTG